MLTAFVSDQIWLCVYPVWLAGLQVDARMTVIRLRSGEIMLHSPCEMTSEVITDIRALGPVGHIVAPGNYHTMYITAAQRAFPNAKTWICPGIERRRPNIRYDGILGDEAPEAWAGEIKQVLMRGTSVMREVAMLHRESRTLILVDLIENFTDQTPHIGGALKFLLKYVARMWNRPTPAPEYRLGWSNRKAVRASLERILAWDFDRIVLSHGDLIELDAKAIARKAWKL